MYYNEIFKKITYWGPKAQDIFLRLPPPPTTNGKIRGVNIPCAGVLWRGVGPLAIWPANFSDLLQKGMLMPNLEKLGQKL